jgi:hypothetical protein
MNKMTRGQFLKLIGVGAAGAMVLPFVKPLASFTGAGVGNTASARSGGGGPVYPIGSTPLGIPMSEWVTRWAQWAFAFPDTESPILDANGRLLMKHQPEGEDGMFIISGGYGVNRKIVISSKQSIMFPVLNGAWGYADAFKMNRKFDNDEQLMRIVREEIDTHSILEATLDGNPVPFYRVDSGGMFYMYNADSTYFNGKAGLTRAFADGYYVFLKPLSKGTHTIFFHGRLDNALVSPPMYDNEVMHFVEVV